MSGWRATIMAVVMSSVALAGCTQGDDPTEGPLGGTTPSSTAPTTGSVRVETTDNETPVGSIEGTVLDDEAGPLAGARVTVRGLRVGVSTGDDGRFQIENVPTGLHVVAVSAPGYDSQSKTVEVKSDEAATLAFTLVPIPTNTTRYVQLPHSALIHVGVFGTSLGGNPTCDACNWEPEIDPGPSHVVFEANGHHTVQHPTRGDALMVFLYKNEDDSFFSGCAGYETNIDSPCARLPMRREFNATQLMAAEPAGEVTDHLRVWEWCDANWFCFEERYDQWLTLFYGTEGASIPADYTAWPPE